MVTLADNGTVPRDKVGIIKMALRGRFQPRIDPRSEDTFVRSLACAACGDCDGLARCLQPEHLAQITQTGTTLLLKACTVGSVDVVALLLQRGAPVNQARASDGDTPLIVACTFACPFMDLV